MEEFLNGLGVLKYDDSGMNVVVNVCLGFASNVFIVPQCVPLTCF